MRRLILSAVVFIGLTVDADAQAISLRAGTLGPGIGFSYPIHERLAVRATGSFLALSQSATADDEDVNVDFDARLQWGGFGLISDWHPFGNSLRLSGGVYYNVIRARGTGIPTGPYILNEGRSNEKVFQPERLGELSAKLTYGSKINPFLGLGIGNAFRGGPVTFLADVGVVYLGSPSLEMSGSGMISGTANQDAVLTDGLSSFKWLPLVSVGISVRLVAP